MAIQITIGGVPGSIADAAIGAALVLDEQGAFVGSVAEVTWELTRPAGSLAALDTAGPIGAAPYTNGFTPDHIGTYRVRLIVTYTDGSVETDTEIVNVRHAYMVSANVPAPLEERERDATTGWADEVGEALNDLLWERSGRKLVTFINRHGAPIPVDRVVGITGQIDFASYTGGETGVPVVGQRPHPIVEAKLMAPGGATNLRYLLYYLGPDASLAVDGHGEAVRYGLIETDTSAWSIGDDLYLNMTDGTLRDDTLLDNVPIVPVARVVQNGMLYWDPRPLEQSMLSGAEVTLLDNQAVAVDVGYPLIWDATVEYALHFEYSIFRADSSQTEIGSMLITLDSIGSVGQIAVSRLSTAVGPGIVFTVFYNGGDATFRLRYTSTATGSNATLFIKKVRGV